MIILHCHGHHDYSESNKKTTAWFNYGYRLDAPALPAAEELSCSLGVFSRANRFYCSKAADIAGFATTWGTFDAKWQNNDSVSAT